MRDDEEQSDLQQRLAAGEQQALVEAFALHRQRLWQIVHFRMDARMAARIDADDVLQDAFLDATLRLKHFGNQETFSPFVWLRMIVGQTLIDAHRRHIGAQQRDARREAKSPGQAFPNSTALSIANFLSARMTSPSQTLSRSEQNEKLRTAIESMQPLDSEVLAMRHFEELSNTEVAEVLGIEQKAASIRYVRALGRLKKMLEDHPDFNDLIP